MRNRSSRILLAREAVSGHLLKADTARHLPPEGTYQCLDPNCGGDLNVCQWPRRPGRLYFRHRTATASANCGFHSGNARTQRRHDAALHLLAVVLNEAIHRREPMPLLEFQVAGATRQVLPLLNAKSVVSEWVCRRTGKRADIALLDRHDDPILLIEVFHTHAVDRIKARAYSDYWWIEVEANAIIADYERLPVIHCGNMPYVFSPETQQRHLPGMPPREW